MVTVGKLKFYPSSKGIAKTSRGKAEPAGSIYSTLSKGEARKLRKALRAEGYISLASAKRQ